MKIHHQFKKAVSGKIFFPGMETCLKQVLSLDASSIIFVSADASI